MPLTQKQIDKLKEIYHEETGIILSNREAWDMGNRLVNLFRLLLTDSGSKQVRTSSNLPSKYKS
jgi:hypothetical protein